MAGRAWSFLSGFLKSGLRRNMALSLLQGLVGMAVILIAYRVLVAQTSVEMLGLWSLTVGIVAFARIADVSGGAGLNRLVAVALLQEKGPARVIDTVTLFVFGLYGLLGLAAIVPFQGLIAASVDPAYQDLAHTLVLWAIGTLLGMVLSTCHLNALDGLHRADLRSGLQILGFVLYLVGALILIPRFGVIGLAAAQLIQMIVVTLCARLALMRFVPGLYIIPVRFSWTELKAAIGYGAKLQASNIAQLIAEPGMRLVVNHFAGLAALAMFDIAQKLTSHISGLASSASRPLVPEFSRSHELDQAARNRLYVRMVQATVPIAALTFALVCLAGPAIGWFILGEIPSSYLFSLACLAAGWCVFTIGIPSIQLARGAGALRWNILGQWTIALGSVGLGSLIGLIDGQYVSLGIALALIAGATLQMIGNSRIYDLPLRQALTGRRNLAALGIFTLVQTGLLVGAVIA